MAQADEIHRVRPDLFIWQAYEPVVKCDLTSSALLLGSRMLLVDPIPLADIALDELLSHGKPELIVCSSANHARAAAQFRQKFGGTIAARAESAPDLGVKIELTLEDGATLLDALEVCTLPGGAVGEVALIHPGGVACVGDALVHLPQTGFAILANKYCTDAKLLRHSLRKLLRYEFSALTFAHGLPLVVEARSRLEALLA